MSEEYSGEDFDFPENWPEDARKRYTELNNDYYKLYCIAADLFEEYSAWLENERKDVFSAYERKSEELEWAERSLDKHADFFGYEKTYPEG